MRTQRKNMALHALSMRSCCPYEPLQQRTKIDSTPALAIPSRPREVMANTKCTAGVNKTVPKEDSDRSQHMPKLNG